MVHWPIVLLRVVEINEPLPKDVRLPITRKYVGWLPELLRALFVWIYFDLCFRCNYVGYLTLDDTNVFKRNGMLQKTQLNNHIHKRHVMWQLGFNKAKKEKRGNGLVRNRFK